MPVPTMNLLLDRLPEEECAQVMACTEAVVLTTRESLYESGVRPRYAYFPTNGIASVVAGFADGSSVEVGIVGREGLVGALHLLGDLPLPMQCSVQVAGSARRLPFSALEKIFSDSPAMHALVLEFIQLGFTNAAQLAACNALHTVEQRLARWLLTVRDRMQSDLFPLTHESLADMLVTRRPTVSVAAAVLQKQGLISYRHGKVQVLDGASLQAVACECHGVSQKLLRHLYS